MTKDIKKGAFYFSRQVLLDSTSNLVVEKNDHPARQFIVYLGKDIIPYIMWDLKNDQVPWFCVLTELLNDQPKITSVERGNLSEMCRLWLDFLSQIGYNPQSYHLEEKYKNEDVK